MNAGAEKIISNNGDSHVALIDDARSGLEDIAAGRTHEANAALAAIQERQAAASSATKPVKNRG